MLATVLRGRWHYLEHGWWAEEGSYVYEPPGDIHALEIQTVRKKRPLIR